MGLELVIFWLSFCWDFSTYLVSLYPFTAIFALPIGIFAFGILWVDKIISDCFFFFQKRYRRGLYEVQEAQFLHIYPILYNFTLVDGIRLLLDCRFQDQILCRSIWSIHCKFYWQMQVWAQNGIAWQWIAHQHQRPVSFIWVQQLELWISTWIRCLHWKIHYIWIIWWLLFDEELDYLLGSHVVVSCKLHEFYDLLLDVSVSLLQCFIIFLHL